MRFSDSGRGANGRLGRFWLYGSEVAEILSAGPSGKHLVKEVSQRWAVCDDWGDKGLVWFMDVPRGQAVPACWGATKFQPKVSAATQDRGGRQTRRSYEGGSIQLVIPVTDTGRNPDPWLSLADRRPGRDRQAGDRRRPVPAGLDGRRVLEEGLRRDQLRRSGRKTSGAPSARRSIALRSLQTHGAYSSRSIEPSTR
ncbi:hypothetical protein ACRAWD_16195 [Caulobacter segnis]